MWVMLTAKIPTEVSPPKMSIFWAIPWPDSKISKEQELEFSGKKEGKIVYDSEIAKKDFYGEDPKKATIYDFWGKEPNFMGAMRIHYKNNDLRIFPHEFSELSLERMKYYVSEEQCYTLVDEEIALIPVAKIKQDPDQKQIYDSALLDGCNTNQATLVMLGIDVSEDEIEFPPLGWYRLDHQYAEVFCDEREMTE